MADMRKNQILEEFRRPNGNKSSKSRDIKPRLHHLRCKETFLTDTQTSDYTKSSGEINLSRLQHLQTHVRKLEKQNSDLRQRVIDLKASQCFEINQEKLKNVIRETDKLKNQLDQARRELEQSLVERDFLQRFNKNLKAQCQTLTKEILILKTNSNSQDSKKAERSSGNGNIYTAREDGQASRSRNSSNELTKSTSRRKELMGRRREKEKEQRSGQNTLKSSLSTSQLHEDYYGGRKSRAKHFKHF